MQSVTFNSATALQIYQLFAGGGTKSHGATPGLVSFTIGDEDRWLVFAQNPLVTGDLGNVAADLATYAAPAFALVKGSLTGADLSPLSAAHHLKNLSLIGAWASFDLAGLTSLQQLNELGLFATSVDDGGLAYLASLTSLDSLDISQTSVNGSGISGLTGLERLKDLFALQTNFDDAGCANLSAVPSLRYLNLVDTAITDSGITNISTAIPTLLQLYVGRNNGITDACIPSLVNMGNLRDLAVSQTSITASGVLSTLALPELVYLDVQQLAVTNSVCQAISQNRTNWQVLAFANNLLTNAALMHFGNLTVLSRLTLHCPNINSAGIASLSSCVNLTDLDLSGCSLDNSALVHLYSLVNLTMLNVMNTGGQIDQAGIEALKAQLPGLTVVTDFSLTQSRPMGQRSFAHAVNENLSSGTK